MAKCPHKTLFYLRFLDDIIGAWPHNISLFDNFDRWVMVIKDVYKVKHTMDPHQVNFLNTTIYFEPINATEKTHVN